MAKWLFSTLYGPIRSFVILSTARTSRLSFQNENQDGEAIGGKSSKNSEQEILCWCCGFYKSSGWRLFEFVDN